MPEFSMGELFAVQLARDLGDGEKAIIGTNSDIQVAACNLARLQQAPNLWWVSGPGGMTNPQDTVIRSTADYENIAKAEAIMELPMMIDFIDWKIHFFDFAILGALQVDQFGNINTVCLGPWEKPKLRGPGTVGISALCALSRRYYVVMFRHDRLSFPKRVDFISGPGHMEGHDSRTKRGLPEGGPRWVVSPFGVFDFEPVSRAMRLMTINEGVTVEEIQDNTSFDVVIPERVPVSRVPTIDELSLLRNQVDTGGALARKFPWPKKAEV